MSFSERKGEDWEGGKRTGAEDCGLVMGTILGGLGLARALNGLGLGGGGLDEQIVGLVGGLYK